MLETVDGQGYSRYLLKLVKFPERDGTGTMSLVERLQAENALSPASRAFSEDAWLDFCLEYLDSPDDDDVYIMGRLIHGALGELRQFVQFSNATSISPYSRRRLIVGLVNHQTTAARLLGKDAVDAIMRTAPGASLEDLADTRIDLPMGSFGMDAIVEAAVDAGARLVRDIPIDSPPPFVRRFRS